MIQNFRHTPMNLSLIGFMGSGKSTIASRLADNLGFDFVDTDALIEKTASKSINEIFNDEGEGVFRKLESQVLEDLVGREGLVIATGGGIVTNKRNINLCVNLESFFGLMQTLIQYWKGFQEIMKGLCFKLRTPEKL